MNRTDLSCIYYDIIKPNKYFPRPIRIMESVTQTPLYDSVGMITREPCYDFHYIISGTGEVKYKNKTYIAGPGQGFIWFKDDKKISYRYPKGNSEPWRFISFCFMQEQMLPTIKSIIENSSPVFTFTGDEPFIKLLFKHISADERITLSPGDAAKMVYDLITTVINASSSSSRVGEFHSIISKTKKLIEKETEADINVSEIARSLNVTREYLSRTFREYTGEKLKDYIIKERIARVCRLLSETSLNVKEIADKLGYSSPSNLSRDFLRITGITPLDYRKNKKYTYF